MGGHRLREPRRHHRPRHRCHRTIQPELRIRLHATRHFGQRELRAIKPSVIQAWLRGLQHDLASSYVRTVLTNVSAVFNAAVDERAKRPGGDAGWGRRLNR